MTKALVLGATGHIGAHIVRALLAEGHSVRAAYRTEKFLAVLEGLPVQRVQVDLDQPASLQGALEGCAWVFHAAGYYPSSREKREEAVRRGMELARRAFEEIARARPQRVVYTSSAATIRPVPDRAANEGDAEPWPITQWRHLYATVKIAMEQEALRAAASGLPVVIVNPSLCIGEYDAHTFSGRAILAFAKYRLPWYTETCFNVVYTGDVGIGHDRAAERGRLGERYLLTGQNLTLKELATLVTEELGLPPPKWRVPYFLAALIACVVETSAWIRGREPLFTRQEVRRVRNGYLLDGSKAVRELGMPQTPVKEGIRRALDWFRQHGILKEIGK